MSWGLQDQIGANKRRAILLVAAFVALVIVAGWVASLAIPYGATGVGVAVGVAAGASVGAWWKSDAIVLALSHARPAAEADHARLHNLVEGLCIAGGLPKPRLSVVPDDAPNAFATGRSPRHATIAVTTGLLEKLNRVELEGVLAHELSHIKNYDTRPSTLAVTLVGLLTAGRLTPFAVSRRRELLADLGSVALTRYPPGLISALETLRDDTTVVHAAARATAHLWIESPAPGAGSDGGMTRRHRRLDTHPPLEERIAALREL